MRALCVLAATLHQPLEAMMDWEIDEVCEWLDVVARVPGNRSGKAAP